MKLTYQNIKDTAEKYGLETVGLERGENLPYDQLVLLLGVDERDAEWLLNVRIFEQEVPQTQDLVEPMRLQFINFFITLPFDVKEECFEDAARLATLVNRGVALPGFNLSETDKRLYYQFTYPVNQGELSEEMFLTLIAFIGHMMQANIPNFEEVATGAKTYAEVMEEAYTFVQEMQKEMEDA